MTSVEQLIKYFKPSLYNLEINIDRKKRQFKGHVEVIGSQIENIIYFHAKDLEIEKIYFKNKEIKYKYDKNLIKINFVKKYKQKIKLLIKFSGKITDSMHGMYPCYYKYNQKNMELIATQFESHHAREVFPCIDEPAAKSRFNLSLFTEKNVQVLSNMSIKEQVLHASTQKTSFETTPSMSTYLLAWVIGDMHKISGRTMHGTKVNIWSTKNHPKKHMDHALKYAVKTIEFFNDYFGIKYPLAKSDHVALPDFSSGAMENWGLITYRETALLINQDNSKIDSKMFVALVIAHEVSHQWFGNLTTMMWWDNLWLNESFATLMEYIAIDHIEPSWNIWSEFYSNEAVLAFNKDSKYGVQSVQVSVDHPDEIHTLFDSAIVYAKGARLLQMLKGYIGEENFKKGLKQYFKKYKYNNTTETNLWEELSISSNKNVSDFMQNWLKKPGFPLVTFSDKEITQRQFYIDQNITSNVVWPIPLDASADIGLKLLSEKSHRLKYSNHAILNFNNNGYFITNYVQKRHDYLIKKIKNNELSNSNLLFFLNDQLLLCRSGIVKYSNLIEILFMIKDVKDYRIWSMVELIFHELEKFVLSSDRHSMLYKKLAHKLTEIHYKDYGWDFSGDSINIVKFQSIILDVHLHSEDKQAIQEVNQIYDKANLENIDAELRHIVLKHASKHSLRDNIVKELISKYKSTSDIALKSDIRNNIPYTRNIDEIKLILSILKNNEYTKPQDVISWYAALISNNHAKKLAWEWLKENWNWIFEVYSNDMSFSDFPKISALSMHTKSELDDYIAFFRPYLSHPALRRTLDIAINDINHRINLINTNSEEVKLTLEKLI